MAVGRSSCHQQIQNNHRSSYQWKSGDTAMIMSRMTRRVLLILLISSSLVPTLSNPFWQQRRLLAKQKRTSSAKASRVFPKVSGGSDEPPAPLPTEKVSSSTVRSTNQSAETDTGITSEAPPPTAFGTSSGPTTFVRNSTARSLPSFSWKQQLSNVSHQLAQIRDTAARPLKKLSLQQFGQEVDKHSTAVMGAVGPAVVALFAKNERGLNFVTVYALALLGSSAGFYLFLYFISIGYAVGISLPVAMALIRYGRQSTLSKTTLVHSLLVVLWGIRSLVFFVWREFYNWPALHTKVVQVHTRQAPGLPIQLLCWFFYSFLYVCMLSPCWFRLEYGAGQTAGWTGVVLQLTGLILESVADWQKSTFKAATLAQRYQWCQVGLWKFSTHPNYLGEWIFWVGTVLTGWAGLTALGGLWMQKAIMLIGLLFITSVLRGAVLTLDEKHAEKYGSQQTYVDFRKSYGVAGPKVRPLVKQAKEFLVRSRNSNSTVVEESTPPLEAVESPSEPDSSFESEL